MLNSNHPSNTDSEKQNREGPASPFSETPDDVSHLNRSRRRALGRGLGALLSSTDLPVSIATTERPFFDKHTSVPDSVLNHPAIISSVESPGNRSNRPEHNNVSPAPILHSNVLPIANSHDQQPGVLFLNPDSIVANEHQPRKTFPEKELQQLADSIRQSGLIQPIVVRPKPSAQNLPALYEIVAGERRYRAAKLAGLSAIPSIVKNIGDRECLALSIVENVQRQDLNPIEEAYAYQRLIEEFGLSAAAVAQEVGRDRSSIANTVRLLKLPEKIRLDMIIGKLTAGHGRAILMVESADSQFALAEQIVKESLSVRQAEELARKLQATEPINHEELHKVLGTKGDKIKSPFILEIEERLRRALGTKLSLNLSEEGRGELRISFFSQDDLQNLIEKIGA